MKCQKLEIGELYFVETSDAGTGLPSLIYTNNGTDLYDLNYRYDIKWVIPVSWFKKRTRVLSMLTNMGIIYTYQNFMLVSKIRLNKVE